MMMESFNKTITIEKLEDKREMQIIFFGCQYEEYNDCPEYWFISASIYYYSGVKSNHIAELFSENIFGKYSRNEAIMLTKLKLVNYLANIQQKITKNLRVDNE